MVCCHPVQDLRDSGCAPKIIRWGVELVATVSWCGSTASTMLAQEGTVSQEHTNVGSSRSVVDRSGLTHWCQGLHAV
jgi:hypothetical protein